MNEKIVLNLLYEYKEGLTITEIVKLSNLSRSFVRTVLAKLDGAGKVSFRNIGMAKVYSLKGER